VTSPSLWQYVILLAGRPISGMSGINSLQQCPIFGHISKQLKSPSSSCRISNPFRAFSAFWFDPEKFQIYADMTTALLS
jgi:hypothetical protein